MNASAVSLKNDLKRLKIYLRTHIGGKLKNISRLQTLRLEVKS